MSRKLVEELCCEDTCPRHGTHWHPLSVASLRREEAGQYTITVRVRNAPARPKRRAKSRAA